MRTMLKQRRGQVTVETAVLFGFVVAGLVAMAVYLQRGVQGGMKSNSDSLGGQFQATAGWKTESKSHTLETPASTTTGQTSIACQGLGGEAMPGDCGATDPDDFTAP